MTMKTSRRALLGATAALAAAPAAALATPAPAATSIAALWDEVVDLTIRMGAHGPAIAAADRGDSVPGWMRLSGEANDLGNARYDRLVAILKTKPADADDLSIVARAAGHRDIVSGPSAFAAGRLADAAMSLRLAA
jgi:hypothetical protein